MSTINSALELQYNNRALVPEHPAIFERWRSASSAFRNHADADLDLAYGKADRQRLDLFRAPHSRGTVVFIHGGYWRSLDKADFSCVAEAFVARGISVATFNYRLCPAVSVLEIITDCRDALTWLLANGPQHGIRVDHIALTGHSAGGHLVSMLFATDWQARGIDASCILGGAALSGIFDLEPLLACSMNADLGLDATSARMVSPIHHRCRLSVPLYLAVGANESAAFREQTRQLLHAWPETCQMVGEIASCNHFTIVDDFVRPDRNSFQLVSGLFV